MLKLIFFGVLAAVFLSFCEHNPSTAKYNVYFWFPDKSQEYFLGVVEGLGYRVTPLNDLADRFDLEFFWKSLLIHGTSY